MGLLLDVVCSDSEAQHRTVLVPCQDNHCIAWRLGERQCRLARMVKGAGTYLFFSTACR